METLQLIILRWLDRIFEPRYRSTLSDYSTTFTNPTENQTLVVCQGKWGILHQDLSYHSNEMTPFPHFT